jgi:energy-coupling factor transporter ATP-binding protein EcfA2
MTPQWRPGREVNCRYVAGRQSDDRSGGQVLEFDGLHKSFGDNRVLDGVGFTVAPGSMFGFCGSNGAGKTTTLVSRQEDLAGVVTPITVVLVAGFFVAIQSAGAPTGTLATVTSYIPGLSPLVMPVRLAAGGASWWEGLIAVVVMLAAIALVVRLGGRIYAGALLRTSGRTKVREALRAERV